MGLYKADTRCQLSKNSGKGWAHKTAKQDHEAPISAERQPQVYIEIPESLERDLILEPLSWDWDAWHEQEVILGKYKRW